MKEYYTAVKKNKEQRYEMTWRDFQCTLWSEKKPSKEYLS